MCYGHVDMSVESLVFSFHGYCISHIFRYRDMGQTLSTIKILMHGVFVKSGADLVEASGRRRGWLCRDCRAVAFASYAAQSTSSELCPGLGIFCGHTGVSSAWGRIASLLSPSRRTPVPSPGGDFEGCSVLRKHSASSTTCRVGSPWARVREAAVSVTW